MRNPKHSAAVLGLSIWAQCFAAAPAVANDAALESCRLERAADKRLACYDAIVVAPRAASPAATLVPAPLPVNRATAAAPAAPVVAPASSFGLPSTSAALDAIDSSIAGRFEGWYPKTRITLTNGQIWQVEDTSSAALALDNPKVRVRRGFAGAFYLEVSGTNRSPRVRRVQ